MTVSVLAIQFNHDPYRKHHSALNLRRNAAEALPLPEWQSDQNGEPLSVPAAYAAGKVAGHSITIRVKLSSTVPVSGSVEVRAIRPQESQWPWWHMWVPHPFQLWLAGYVRSYLEYLHSWQLYKAWASGVIATGNVLGDVKPKRIDLSAEGEDGWHWFELQNARLASRGVGRHKVIWLWQYRPEGSSLWIDMDTTSHTIYTVLDPPTEPWRQLPFGTDNTQLPWIDVLDFACAWAAGAVTKSDVAQRITRSVFALGSVGLLEYGCPIWAMEMYAKSSDPWNHFDCTAFIERLRGGVGNGRYVNCTDCASIVSTFANILGCDLWQSRMGKYLPHFDMNKIIAIGSREWEIPCGIWPGFSFHEVAWTGQCDVEDKVYDACLLVDLDMAPWADPQLPWLPVNMRFGRAGELQYRDRLAAPAGSQDCTPRPWEQRRRLVF